MRHTHIVALPGIVSLSSWFWLFWAGAAVMADGVGESFGHFLVLAMGLRCCTLATDAFGQQMRSGRGIAL